MREILESQGWVVNEIQQDYGIDFNVQVFEAQSPTGDWFHVQLKSSGSTEYSADGSFISQKLPTTHARHFALEIRDPVFLLHADVTRMQLFWHAPQLDRPLIALLSKTGAESVIVRISTKRKLEKSLYELLAELEKVYLVLGSRKITSASAQSFERSIEHISDEEALRRAFQKKNDVLKLHKIADLFRQRRLDEARPRAELMLSDPDSDIETKFWTTVQLGGIEYTETARSGKSQSELYAVGLRKAKALQRLTKTGPPNLKFYSLVSRISAELHVLIGEHETLFMAEQQHLQGFAISIPALLMYTRRAAVTHRISRKYNQCLRLVRYAVNYPNRWLLGRALIDIVTAIGHYLIPLDYLGEKEATVVYAKSALRICKLAAQMCVETGDSEGAVLAILGSLSTTRSKDSEAYQWSVETANRLSDSQLRSEALRLIARAESRWQGKKVEGDFDWDSEWQIVQKIAIAQGIDLSDENSLLVRGLRLAAKDSSPARIMADCEHLLVTPGKMGPTAQTILELFNITTAGSKVIHCTLHNFHLEDRDQDVAYAQFKKLHCASCKDCKSRPENWQYTDREKHLIQAKHSHFVRKLVGTEKGYRFSDED
jgi:hypothetical protein